MKSSADLVQYLIIVGLMVYPIYYVWEVEKVDRFCEQIDSGMTRDLFLTMATQKKVKLEGPSYESVQGGKWDAYIVPRYLLSGEVCLIKGIGDTVAIAKLIE
jgi:hypothetical protein